MKRICALLLAVILAFGMCPIANAEESTEQSSEALSLSDFQQADSLESDSSAKALESFSVEGETEEMAVGAIFSELTEGMAPGVDYVDGEAILSFKDNVTYNQALSFLSSQGWSEKLVVSWLEPSEMKDGKAIKCKIWKR